jgi:acyl-CoA dehydrogenase
MNDLFTDALQQHLARHCTSQTIRDIEEGLSFTTLWSQLEESGFPNAMVPEAQGGAGLYLAEAFSLFELCGSFAVPVPLAETILVRAILSSEGMQLPPGSITLAEDSPSATGNVFCPNVPFGKVADWVIVGNGDHCRLLPVSSATQSPAVFPLDAALQWSKEEAIAANHLKSNVEILSLQACINAARLAGALMTVFTRTLQYANERTQFGRPIGKFQAIQHQLSVIAEHTCSARMAAQLGCQAVGHKPDVLRVAVAKARTSEAALEVAALSHSIHGAIGFTSEFDLQLYTRRLHAWRHAGGSESYWYSVLGEALVDGHKGLAIDVIRSVSDVN